MIHQFPHPDAIASIAEQLVAKKDHFTGDTSEHKAIRSLVDRLHRKADAISSDWPVPVSEEDSQNLRKTLYRALQAIEMFLGSPNSSLNPGSLVKVLEGVLDELDHLFIVTLARNSRPDDVVKMVEQLNGLVDNAKAEYEALNKKSKLLSQRITIKQQQGYFADQAYAFRRIGLIGLAATIGFIIALIFLLSCQGETNIMADYLDQERELVVNAYNEHKLTKQTLGSAMSRFNESCEGCMQRLFLNTLIRANAVRIVSVSFVLFLIAVGLKVFYSGFHNYTINMQRSNSLLAALELFDKLGTPEARNALMDKVCTSIFAHQSTAFNSRPPANMMQTFLDQGKQA
jgi:hypothetical protein